MNMKSSISLRLAWAEIREYQTHIWLKPWLVLAELDMGSSPAAFNLSMAISKDARSFGVSVIPALANFALL